MKLGTPHGRNGAELQVKKRHAEMIQGDERATTSAPTCGIYSARRMVFPPPYTPRQVCCACRRHNAGNKTDRDSALARNT